MSIRAAGAAVLLLGLVMTAGAAIAARVLTIDGLGAVHFGMTVAEIERALGVRLKPDPPEAVEPCWFAIRADRVDPGIAYMIEGGQLTRIDIYIPRDRTLADVTVAGGIAIGSAIDDVRRVYGSALDLRPSDANPGQVEISVAKSKDRAMVLSVSRGRVDALRAGLVPSIEYPEGCS